MKIIIFLISLILFIPSSIYAGQVYGSLTERNRSVEPGVRIIIGCGPNTYKGVTDKYGSYNIYVPQRGKCNMTVFYGKERPTTSIYSYSDPIRYDFELVRDHQGRYVLRRR